MYPSIFSLSLTNEEKKIISYRFLGFETVKRHALERINGGAQERDLLQSMCENAVGWREHPTQANAGVVGMLGIIRLR